MKKLILLASIVLSAGLTHAQVIVTDTSVFQRVKHVFEVNKTYCSGMYSLEAIFPYIQSNHYQIIENPVVFSPGTVRDNAEGGNKYIGYSLHTPQLNQLGNTFEIGMEFDVATININVNFNAIDTIYPYDTTSAEYIENTGNLTSCIQPHHPHIDSVSNILWNQSTDIIDYARRCYLYTATHLNYINANTGLHSIQDIINDGGGDCGNFSSYYISLLRCRNIPSRHVVTVLGLDDYHIWAEFYLQNYGWIPVDPTFKNSNPSGDYFGHKNSSHYITTLGAGLTSYQFDDNDEPIQIMLMQMYYWYWWANNPCTYADFNFVVQRLPTATVKCISSDTLMGSVAGGGRYTIDNIVTLTATANDGYHFTQWSDGSTYNPYIFTVLENKTLTAFFAPDNEPMSDTVFVYLHDTTYITMTDTISRIDTVTVTEYVTVHDTTVSVDTLVVNHYIHDTSTVFVFDTVLIDNFIYDTTTVLVHDTTVVMDTVTLTEYVPVHDTTFVDVFVHDTTVIVDTVTIDNFIHDTTIVIDTLHIVDTIYITDTVYIDTTGVGVDEVSVLNVKMYVQGSYIVVENSDGRRVSIYDVAGRLLTTKQDSCSPVRFPVATSGVYMIKVGSLPTRKIVVVR